MSRSSKLTLLLIAVTNNFQYQSQFLRIQVTNRPNIFVNQGQYSEPEFISGTHQRENVQFADTFISLEYYKNIC